MDRAGRRSSLFALAAASLVLALAASTAGFVPRAAAAASAAQGARVHAICSGPGSAKVPCRFSTKSGNIRCIWTPSPNSVACVLRSTGRAYRLRPTGHARAIRLTLRRPGRALPLAQQIVFPQSLSCHGTPRTMTCNQDFGTGAFTLAPHGSHRS